MAMIPTWHNDEKTILALEFTNGGIKTWAEYHQAMTEAFEMAKTVPHTVYLVVNGGKNPMPAGSPIQHLRRSVKMLPHNVPVAISIVDNVFAEIILNILTRVNVLHDLYTCKSWDAAYKYIEAHQAQQTTSV